MAKRFNLIFPSTQETTKAFIHSVARAIRIRWQVFRRGGQNRAETNRIVIGSPSTLLN